MDYHIQRFNNTFSFFRILALPVCIFLSLFMLSCAQNSADIKQSEITVVFEYPDEENFPSARLCAFVESESDSRRSGLIQVSTQKEGFVWNSDTLVRIKNGDRFWTGYTNFVMQKNEPFPLDSYRILLQNADEQEADEVLQVEYNTSFYKLNAAQAEKHMLETGAAKKLAVYDENNVLLYYGDFKETLSSSRKIWNVYPKANYYNVIWQTMDASVICILPKQLVVPDENN